MNLILIQNFQILLGPKFWLGPKQYISKCDKIEKRQDNINTSLGISDPLESQILICIKAIFMKNWQIRKNTTWY